MELKPRMFSLGLCLLVSVHVNALANCCPPKTHTTQCQQINVLIHRAERLQKTIKQLQSEIAGAEGTPIAPSAPSPEEESTTSEEKTATCHATCDEKATASTDATDDTDDGSVGTDDEATPSEDITKHIILGSNPLYIGGMPVITSPYLGIRSAFDGSDLIASLPQINEGLHLLQERQKIESIFEDNDIPLPQSPLLALSGTIGGEVQAIRPQSPLIHSTTDNYPSAGVGAMGNINAWTTTFTEMDFDTSPPGFGPVAANSRVFFDEAFVVLGNLNRLPIYLAVGQMYPSFGQYNTSMLSDPLTLTIGRIKARPLLLGFEQLGESNTLDEQLFAYRGDAGTSRDRNNSNFQMGGNVDYAYTADAWNAGLGVSLDSNIADSDGMQLTPAFARAARINLGFAGFGGPVPVNNTELLVHRVPGFDAHGNIGVGSFGLSAEEVNATTPFNVRNMSFNGRPAKPSAADVELSYSFSILDKHPSTVAVGYQQTRQALALFLPKTRYVAAFSTSIWESTIEALEFRHDINYPASDVGKGQNTGINFNALGQGYNSDSLTAEIIATF